MAGADLSPRVEKVVGYPPLSEMNDQQRREFHEALLEAGSFEDLTGKRQAAILDGAEPAEAADRHRRLSRGGASGRGGDPFRGRPEPVPFACSGLSVPFKWSARYVWRP
jgi:hypothetical protein